MVLFLNRVFNKIRRKWRIKVFRLYTKNKKANVNIVGKMTLINPNIKVGNNVTFYPDVMLFGDGLIEIGDNVDIGNGTIIYASKGGGIKIGNKTMIAAQCYIIDCDHGIKVNIPIRGQANTVKSIEIGENAWLAAGVKILKGSKVGNGAVIGANSVVKGEIPDNAIAVGAPAKVKKYRE